MKLIFILIRMFKVMKQMILSNSLVVFQKSFYIIYKNYKMNKMNIQKIKLFNLSILI